MKKLFVLAIIAIIPLYSIAQQKEDSNTAETPMSGNETPSTDLTQDKKQTEKVSVSENDPNNIIIEKIEFNNIPVRQALLKLRVLSKKSDPQKKGIHILMRSASKEKSRQPITMNASNISVKDAVDYICKAADLEYKMESDRVVVSVKNESNESAAKNTETPNDTKNKVSAKVQNQKLPDNSGVTKSMVAVDGDKKKYNGFIANINGKKSIVTDIHSLLNNSALNFRDINNNKITPTALYISTEREVLIAEIPDGSDLPALAEADLSNIQQNTDVTIGRSSRGDKFISTDNKTIAVKSRFSEKDSGSPIISNETGKVIGVATYIPAQKKGLFKGAGQASAKAKRLGYRIDNINGDELQIFEKNKYRNDLNKYAALVSMCAIGDNLINELTKSIPKSSTGYFKPINVTLLDESPEIKSIAEEWNTKVDDYNTSLKKASSKEAENKKNSDKAEESKNKNTAKTDSKKNGITSTNVVQQHNTDKKHTMNNTDNGGGKTMLDAQGVNFKNILSKMEKSLSTFQSACKEGSFNYRYIANESEKYSQRLDSITKSMDSYIDKLEKNTKENKKAYAL